MASRGNGRRVVQREGVARPGPLLERLRRPQWPDVRRWNDALGAYPGERETPRRLPQALRQRLVDVHARRRDRNLAAAVRSRVSHDCLERGGAVSEFAERAGFEFHPPLRQRLRRAALPGSELCALQHSCRQKFRQRLSPQRSPENLSARYGVLGARTDKSKSRRAPLVSVSDTLVTADSKRTHACCAPQQPLRRPV